MLKNRPAAFLCLVFSTGIAAGLFFSPLPTILISLAGVVIAAIIRARRQTAWIVLLSAVSLLVGTVYASVYNVLAAPHKPEAGVEYSFYAAVREVTARGNKKLVVFEVQDDRSEFDGERMCMYLESNVPSAGDVVEVTGTPLVAGANNRSDGISYTIRGSYAVCTDRQPQGIFFDIVRLRKWIGTVIGRAYRGEAAEFYRGLITGDRSGLDARLNASFSRSGIAHIMAISGQHFSLIVFSVVRLLIRKLRWKRFCYSLGIVLAVAYAVFTGASPSILRAAFMCCAMFVAKLINERSDPLINLCLALVVVITASPYALFSISLQLSFLATAGIVFVLNYLDKDCKQQEKPRKWRWITEPVVMSAASALFCTPVYLSRFDYISVVSPVTNLVVNIFVIAAMASGILLLPLAAIIRTVAVIPELFYHCIRYVADWVSAMRFACVSVELPYIRLLFIPSLVAVVAFAFIRLKKGLLVFLGAFSATVLITAGCLYAQHISTAQNALLYVHDTEVSNYILFANGDGTVLVDGSGSGTVDDGVFGQGYTYIDAYVVTACTEESVFRLKSTLPYAPIDTLYLPTEESVYAAELERIALEGGCKLVRYPNQRLYIGGLTIYTAAKVDVGGYALNICHKGSAVMVFGGVEGVDGYYTEHCDGAVFTVACAYSPVPGHRLPERCGKAFVGGTKQGDVYSYLTNYGVADYAEYYSSGLVLRIGEDGVIKE